MQQTPLYGYNPPIQYINKGMMQTQQNRLMTQQMNYMQMSKSLQQQQHQQIRQQQQIRSQQQIAQ